MATIDFSSGYRDATKGATLKALQKRQDDQAAATALAMKPREIGSMWQGAAQIGDVISGSVREGRLANQEAAGRARFAELLAGGLAPDEVGEAMGLDPETTMKFQERNWAQEDALTKHGWDVDAATQRQKDAMAQQKDSQTFTASQTEDTQAHAIELQEKSDAAQLVLADHNASIDEKKAAQKVIDDAKVELERVKTDAAKAEQDAALNTPQGERAAAVKAGTMTPEKAAELNKIDEDKARADAAAAGPDQWQTPSPEVAAKQGGDVGRNPGSYLFNAKTGEFKPVEKARTPSDLKTTGEFEAGLTETRSAKTALKRALDLSPNIFEGGGAPGNINIPGTDIGIPEGTGNAIQRAKAILMLPKGTPGVSDELRKQAEDTIAYNNIMSEESIKAMGVALKGANTDFELKEFQRIMSDPGTPLATKQEQIKRMLTKLDVYEQIQTKQVTESGGDPTRGQAAPDAADATAPSEEDIAETMRANNMTREQVIAEFNRRRGGG